MRRRPRAGLPQFGRQPPPFCVGSAGPPRRTISSHARPVSIGHPARDRRPRPPRARRRPRAGAAAGGRRAAAARPRGRSQPVGADPHRRRSGGDARRQPRPRRRPVRRGVGPALDRLRARGPRDRGLAPGRPAHRAAHARAGRGERRRRRHRRWTRRSGWRRPRCSSTRAIPGVTATMVDRRAGEQVVVVDLGGDVASTQTIRRGLEAGLVGACIRRECPADAGRGDGRPALLVVGRRAVGVARPDAGAWSRAAARACSSWPTSSRTGSTPPTPR